MQIIYEDNHIIIVAKQSGEIVQGDKTGDTPLSETVKAYIKEKYQKPGAVFLGVVHRLDRPVSGLVVFARTSKALSRLNDMFRKGEVHKTYWALVETPTKPPQGEASDHSPRHIEWHTVEHWLTRNEKQNKSYAYDREVPGSKKAMLKYRMIGHTDRYTLLEVNLMTGREETLCVAGRHDPCVAHRARAAVDSVVALALCDLLAQRYGTDWPGDRTI